MSKSENVRLILNLAGSLSNQTAGFLKQNGFTIVEKDQVDTKSSIVFILVSKHNEDWKTIETTYDTIKKGIKVISFTRVINVKSFISIGGRACISDEIFTDKTSLILAKRIFNDDLSLHMDEAFGGNFLKYKNQKILGHARSGHVADIISLDALEQGFNNVGVRGFLYNIIYYLAYLKQTDIALYPFDLEYAQNGKFFAVQIVAPVKNFMAEYIQDSFNIPNSSNPVDYLLFEAKNLTDFLDISYVEKSNSVVFLAFWFKLGEKRENGFAFNQIKSVKRVYQEIEEQIQELQTATTPVIVPIKKLADNKVDSVSSRPLPGKIIEKLDYIEEMAKILPTEIQDDVVSSILGKAKTSDVTARVKGTTLKLTEETTLVKGGIEEGEEGTIVKGTKDNEESLTMVKGSKEVLGKDNNIIKGLKEDFTEANTHVGGADDRFVSGFATKIKNSGNDEDKKGLLKSHVTDFIYEEIENIYKAMGEPVEKDLEELTVVVVNNLKIDNDKARKMVNFALSEYKKKNVKDEATTVKGDSISYKESVLLQKLKEKEDAVKQLTTKVEVLRNEILLNKEKNIKITEIKDATENNEVSEDDKLIIASKKEYQRTGDSAELTKLIGNLEKAPDGQVLADLLRKLQIHESELIELSKANEVELKKKDQETKGKEVFWSRALETSERNLKNKELLLTKAKDGVKITIEKKDDQINALQDRINQLSLKVNVGGISEEQFNKSKELNNQLQGEVEILKKKLVAVVAATKNIAAPTENIVIKAADPSAISEHQFAEAKELNEKLQVEVDTLKRKMVSIMVASKNTASVAENIMTKVPTGESDEAVRLKADIQRLGSDKTITQNQINVLKGENNTLKNELADTKKRLNEFEQNVNAQKIIAASNAQNSQANKDAGLDPAKVNTELNKMIKERDHKIELNVEKQKELESKIATLLKEKEGAALLGEQSSKTKITQLETTNKKLTADLLSAQTVASETKKEVTKIKAESMGLKNQIDKLKKDLEKNEKASKLKKVA